MTVVATVILEKTQDAKITGGTVNGIGAFIMRAERVGSDRLLAQIVRMMCEAQRSERPMQPTPTGKPDTRVRRVVPA